MSTATKSKLLDDVTTLHLLPWVDPLIEADGHDPRSAYVETFWLPVIGPTATLLLRRLSFELDAADQVTVDLGELARAMGLTSAPNRNGPFRNGIQRLMMFGLATYLPPDRLALRRSIPDVPRRHLTRMPESMIHAHADVVG